MPPIRPIPNPMHRTLSLLLLTLALLAAACRPDRCETLNCQNGGTCLDDACQCPEGFIGPQCTVELDPCVIQRCDTLRTDACDILSDGSARCRCRAGFEGDRCTDEWAKKYIRNYLCAEACDGFDVVFNVEVLDGPEFRKITFANFNNKASATQTAKVVAYLDAANVFEIGEQFMYFGVVQGAGTWSSNGQIGMSYTIDTGSDTLACVATLTPQ
ncbi:MAG: hypothetical protein OHK0039_05610 [Bacteroidia bacterium]